MVDTHGKLVPNFICRKYESNGWCNCDEWNKPKKEINFPDNFPAADKAAILFAASKLI